MYKTKLDGDVLGAAKDRIEKNLASAERDNALLKQDVKNLEGIVAATRAKYAESEEKNKDNFAQIKALHEHVKELEKHNKLSADAVDQKAKELRTAESARTATERENAVMNGFRKAHEDLTLKNQQLQKQISKDR